MNTTCFENKLFVLCLFAQKSTILEHFLDFVPWAKLDISGLFLFCETNFPQKSGFILFSTFISSILVVKPQCFVAETGRRGER